MTAEFVRIEGNLLSHSVLEAIRRADAEVPGMRPEDYHLAAGERLNHAASRKWNYLTGVYKAFRDRLADLPDGDPATSLTRERWTLILLDELGYGRVPYVRGISVGDAAGDAADARSYPVSHAWGQVPMHLLGWHADLDRRAGNGSTGRAPQGMFQEFLNVSDDHLWGVLSNGRLLRVLRDSTNLVGAAYVEFDLEAIFDGDSYTDFVLLYALAHVSRLEPRPVSGDGMDGEPVAAGGWLERWRAYAADTGSRARERMRVGVKNALERLGTGFLRANPKLAEALAAGRLPKDDLRHELLRLAYQLIFCFVTEDRGVLLDPDADAAARRRYIDFFSTARLREMAARRYGDRHGDLWRALVFVLDGLGAGDERLALPALGGLFFRDGERDVDLEARPDHFPPDFLRDCLLPNRDLLQAVRHLATFRDRQGRRHVTDFRHLGAEELGSVYESLLELIPDVEPGPEFVLRERPGNERKTTGSYYTPDSLIQCLLDTALDPVIADHARGGDPDNLLNITVCDPACGSGHFLVAAARRIAKRYAAMYTGEDEPVPDAVRAAMHRVVARCVYAVDVNPLAAELAKVSLWLESVEPGRPLAFLDAHIKVGNALLGATPALLEAGIPDDAFKPLDKEEDRSIVRSLKKENDAVIRARQETIFAASVVDAGNAELAEKTRALAAAPPRSLSDIREQVRRFRELSNDPARLRAKRVADAWCAAFVWPKRDDVPRCPTSDTLIHLAAGERVPDEVRDEIDRYAERYAFFHWHLEFPEIFRVVDDEQRDHNPEAGWQGGFDCVVGNPPWERVKLQEQEFFAARRPEIAKAPNANARKKLIAALADSDDQADVRLFADFREAQRESAGWSHFLRTSGRFPLTGRGDVNTYAVFAETDRLLTSPRGRMGAVLPTGIATDSTTQYFFRDLVETHALASLFDFENEEKVFPHVHNQVRFCLITIGGRARPQDEIGLAFRARQAGQIAERSLTITPKVILQLNPNTGTSPVFDGPRHAEIVVEIYRRVPVLWRERPEENPWALSFLRMFDMAGDSRLFRARAHLEREGWELRGNVFIKGGDRMVPLYEGKMVHHFDHRFATYDGATQAQLNKGTLPRLTLEQHTESTIVTQPESWVSEAEVEKRLSERWRRGWLLGWRDMCRSADERTVISAAIPRAAVGDKYLLALTDNGCLLQANFSSFVFDYCARQKFIGTSLKYFLFKQLPALPPEAYRAACSWDAGARLNSWITQRVLELSYTAWDMEPFARDLGDDGPPFVWDTDRRFAMRAELDAAFFHLYGVERDDVDYIMDSFRAFRNNDPDRFARTKELILRTYDAMAKAVETCEPYRTILNPPPGHGLRHPASTRPAWS